LSEIKENEKNGDLTQKGWKKKEGKKGTGSSEQDWPGGERYVQRRKGGTMDPFKKGGGDLGRKFKKENAGGTAPSKKTRSGGE